MVVDCLTRRRPSAKTHRFLSSRFFVQFLKRIEKPSRSKPYTQSAMKLWAPHCGCKNQWAANGTPLALVIDVSNPNHGQAVIASLRARASRLFHQTARPG